MSVIYVTYYSPQHACLPASGGEATSQPCNVYGMVSQKRSYRSGQHNWRGTLKYWSICPETACLDILYITSQKFGHHYPFP